MTYAKFDDTFWSHPKVVGLTNEAFRLHVSAICYAAHHLTDGFIPTAITRQLLPECDRGHVRELVDAGLWSGVRNGYQIHDYTEWNRSKAQVEKWRKSGSKGAQRRWHG